MSSKQIEKSYCWSCKLPPIVGTVEL